MDALIKVIGIGPGSKEFLTFAAEKAIREAEVVIAGERTLKEWAKPNQRQMVIKNNLQEVIDFLKESKKNEKVVVLASGDPGMYGILNFLLKHFREEELEVIPGISSVQLAAAKMKISWHDGAITSVHGRPLEGLKEIVKFNDKVFILTDPKANPAQIAKFLLAEGIRQKKATVCANLSYPNEEIKTFSLESLAEEEKYQACILVIEGEDSE